MARESKDRHVWGETNPLYFPVKSGTTIKTGDCVIDDGAGANLDLLAGAVNTNFAGVAMQDSVSADPAQIRVATDGVFEFDTDSASYAPGDFVQYDTNAQKVQAGSASNAIGRVWKYYSSNVTKVWVKIDTKLRFSHPS